MESNLSTTKWEAKFSRKLTKTKGDQIWPLFENFIGLNKYFTVVPTSYCIHGTNGEAGCIRYFTGFDLKLPGKQQTESKQEVTWSKERLVAIDRAKMTLTYEVMESNVGFNSYVATFKIVPATDGGSDMVEWFVSVEPLAGLSLEEFERTYELWLKLILDNMEAAAVCQSLPN